MELQRLEWIFENGSPARISSFGVWLDMASPTPAEAVSMVEAAMAAAVPATANSWEDIVPTDVNLLRVTTQRFQTVVVPVSTKYPYGLRWSPTTVEFPTTAATINGPASTPGIPPQCAQVLSLRTALPGRRHRGRVYLPPAAESEVSNAGLMTAARAAEADEHFAEWVSAAITDFGVATWVVASIADEHFAENSPFFQEVIAHHGDRKIGTVRRRTGRVG